MIQAGPSASSTFIFYIIVCTFYIEYYTEAWGVSTCRDKKETDSELEDKNRSDLWRVLQ